MVKRLLCSVIVATTLAACSASERDGNSATTLDGGRPEDGIRNPDIQGVDGGADAAQCLQNVDIVFVMDVSSSMDKFLNKLAQEMEAVDSSIRSISPSASPYYGLVVFVDNAKMLNNGNPFQNVGALKSEFQKWASFTFMNKQIDSAESNTTWPENSLDALHTAATSFAWRGGSLRIVIHTTDDTFWDGPGTHDGMPSQFNYAQVVQALSSRQIRMFSFASKLGGEDENVDVAAGWFNPFNGQDPIPKATFGSAYELDQVLNGQTSLSTSIYGLVNETFCKPYEPIR